ncbi:MAG: S46 family peptidase [Phycisphaerae bacterium]
MRNAFLSILLASVASHAPADEGMWLLSKPPVAAIKSAYGVDVAPEWLDRMQKSAVRFSTGGSGSLVSAEGLVMTNHHVGSDMISKLSTPERDFMKNGFLARTRADELKCPDLVLDILWEIEDVTAKVEAAAKGLDPAAAGAARRRVIGELEAASKQATGLKSEVVTLFQGGQYHLYRYRTYTDVRLVFAPEEQAAFFGGDTDNFEFPRFNLDCCFFRIYDQGKPLRPEHHLSWSPAGAAEGQPVFVFGHPGRTRRLFTHDHLRFLRDAEMPLRMQNLWRSEIKAQSFAGRSPENARVVRDDLMGIANSRKASTGLLAGLQDPRLMASKKAAEDALRAKVAADPAMAAKWSDAWGRVATAQQAHKAFLHERQVFDGLVRGSTLLSQAMHVVRLADELKKPDAERLREYKQAGLEQFYFRLYSPEPIHDELEIHALTVQLSRLCEEFGAEHETVAALLAGKSPADRAAELVKACTFKDPAARKALVEGGTPAIKAANDPLLAMAASLDPLLRRLRSQYEDQVESVERSAYAAIAAARFAVDGDAVYPDATFTLRLSYGAIKPVPGEPAFTDLGGMFAKAVERGNEGEFRLPAAWAAAREKLDLKTPFNFVCTADIIGGNSGSPVVNAKGEVVGLIFDGNIHSLVGDVVYDQTKARAVAVDSRGMIEAIDKIYGASELVSELRSKLAR